jgi:hypothetical protein
MDESLKRSADVFSEILWGTEIKLDISWSDQHISEKKFSFLYSMILLFAGGWGPFFYNNSAVLIEPIYILEINQAFPF